jgi:high-affinity iron transporter
MRWLVALGAGFVALAVGGCGGAGTSASKRPAVVRVSYDGTTCAPGWSALRPGGYDFVLQDRANDAIAMTLLNASDGSAASPTKPVMPGGRASIDTRLRAGASYAWRCQTPSQAAATSVAIRVPSRGHAASGYAPAPLSIVQLYQPMAEYTRHESRTLAKLRGQLATLQHRLAEGDIAGAKSAWLGAHVRWLELGQDDGAYGAFGILGSRIDGTAEGDVGGVWSPSFTGFHRVELDLWRRQDLTAARGDAATLRRLVDSIDQRKLSQDLPDTTVALDSWVLRCHEILEDALRDTLSGKDDYGSHTGLATIGADVAATREVLRLVAGLIKPRRPGLVQSATRQLAAVAAAIRPSRAVPVAALPRLRRLRIDGAIGTALETLAPVSELMQISSADS